MTKLKELKEYLNYEWIELDKIEEYNLCPKAVKKILKERKYPAHMINIDEQKKAQRDKPLCFFYKKKKPIARKRKISFYADY